MKDAMDYPHTPEELAHIHPELLPPPGTKALFFDLDGTLIDTLSLYHRCWLQILAPHGFEPSVEWYASAVNLPMDPFLERALPDMPYDERAQVGRDAMALYESLVHEVEPMERTVEVVHAFHGRLPMAVVTAAFRGAVERALKSVGLEGYFDVIITNEDVATTKPHPDCYLKALELMGVSPDEAIVYEDAPGGMAAAQAAGIRYIDVRPHTGGIKATH